MTGYHEISDITNLLTAILPPPQGLSVKAEGGLAVVQPQGFLAICGSADHGTGGTTVNDHPVILHAFVNGIALVSRSRCFVTMV